MNDIEIERESIRIAEAYSPWSSVRGAMAHEILLLVKRACAETAGEVGLAMGRKLRAMEQAAERAAQPGPEPQEKE